MSVTRSMRRSFVPRKTDLKVPEITVFFWVIKLLTTAVGEATSDYMVHTVNPYLAVLIGLVGFVVALVWQLSRRRYIAGVYWLAVLMVAVFGTMAADALHVGLGVPYFVSTAGFAVVLGLVFVGWYASERTLSIHSIHTLRRELLYWAAIVVTFALGTAAGDMTAFSLHLGFVSSIVLFAVAIAVPAVGYALFGWNDIFSFWFAYVLTRPLGASIADWMDFPRRVGGLDLGRAWVALSLTLAIALLVGYLAATRSDVPGRAQAERLRRATGAARRGRAPRGAPELAGADALSWIQEPDG